MNSRRIGNCTVLEEIGQGGMAVVHRAVQVSLERPVAIKELKPEYARDEQVCQRFEREALSVARLQHENIVPVYDYVEDDSSRYIIMEYVEGVNLHDLLSRVERLPAEVAAIIALQLARALEYAHFSGVVHRDIKPSNIVISKLGEVKLMDFGIARAEVHEEMTRPGIALGTPSFMSPEQIMGERVDWRSDMFSFGIVLYQMLTGRKPFRESTQHSVMQAILKEDYPPPRTLQPDIPSPLCKVLHRCLRKTPAERFRSSEALRAALERFVARQARINSRGRLVAFLHHRGLVTEEDALTVLTRAELTAPDLSRADLTLPTGPLGGLGRLAAVAAAAGLVIGLGAAAVEWWPGGNPAVTPRTVGGQGHLRVQVWPWARVFVDGAFIDTTPFVRAIALEPGQHVVELRNEHFEDERRVVEIEADRTATLRAELRRPREPGS